MPNKKKLRLVRMSDNECLQARELNGGALKKESNEPSFAQAPPSTG